MKIKRTLYFIPLLSCLSIFSSCDNAVYDDLRECPQGVDFKFYRQTPCSISPSYPSDVKQVRVFAFDGNGVLVGEYSDSQVFLSADYKLSALLPAGNTFTFVVWGGGNLSECRFSSFEKGKTKKDDMLLSLIHEQGTDISKSSPLCYGAISRPVDLSVHAEEGSVYESVSINLEEITSHINLTIKGLLSTDKYAVRITQESDTYGFDGDFHPASEFEYAPSLHREGTVLRTDFMTMKLIEHHGPRLSVINTTSGKTVYTAALVDDLIMYRGDSGEPPYSLSCTHDFDIELTIESHVLVKAVVNDWNVITRPVELD